MSAWHGGKGSTPRKVDKKKFDENWDKIFGKKNDAEVEKEYDFSNAHRGPLIVDGKLNPEKSKKPVDNNTKNK